MVSLLLGQQKGYTKYSCFLCMWDSRDRKRHWIQKEWPKRDTLKRGMPNVIHNPIVSRDKIIFPPLHIKLGLIKQFVKALSVDGECFQHLMCILPGSSYKKNQSWSIYWTSDTNPCAWSRFYSNYEWLGEGSVVYPLWMLQGRRQLSEIRGVKLKTGGAKFWR